VNVKYIEAGKSVSVAVACLELKAKCKAKDVYLMMRTNPRDGILPVCLEFV
jgi:hypothetical protein